MDRPAASPSAEDLLKFFRRENEVGVIKIKMSASEYAAHHAAYLAAARVPFRTETIYLAHQPAAAVTLDAPAQERPARAQPSAQPSAQRTAPSGWWLIPAVVVVAAIWGLIIWWLL
jgi:hypothetical protein